MNPKEGRVSGVVANAIDSIAAAVQARSTFDKNSPTYRALSISMWTVAIAALPLVIALNSK